MENIQSLSICCPSATGKCINHCKTCTARQHTNPYENKFHSSHTDCMEYWNDVIKRMQDAQDKGCTTVMLTGSNEPQQDRRWLEGLYLAMKSLKKPFNNIEIQTTGAFLDKDYLRFLKDFGVTTIAVSTFNIFDDKINIEVEGNADKNLKIEELCENIYELGMNIRVCINVTDYVYENLDEYYDKGIIVHKILERCAELHANQVTFRKMWASATHSTCPEVRWIYAYTKFSDLLLEALDRDVKNYGTLLGTLPYGAARYDYLGFSIVIDTDSMAKDVDNSSTKYYIIRENGKMYSSWDSPASLVF